MTSTDISSKRKVNCELFNKKVVTQRKLVHIVFAAVGLSNKKIAEKLCISESTVKKTFEDIFRKLGATDRASMVNIAWIMGILDNNIQMNILKEYDIM